MDDERLITSLLLKFSDKESGWVSVHRGAALLPVTDFVRSFETFVAETESYVPRRRRNFGWLRKTIIRCLDAWNHARNQTAVSQEEVVTVEVVGDQLTNVAFVRQRARSGVANRRVETPRRASPRRTLRGGITKPAQRMRPRRQPRQPAQGYRPKWKESLREVYCREEERKEVPMKGEIVIRNEFAGAILGRRGSTIQSIRLRSGGHVHLSESMDGQTRMIEVHGEESQVMEAHRQVNQILHREYPDHFPKGIMVSMKATIELKMGIELATYLTGMNRTMLAEIQTATGIAATLHDVEGDDGSKFVRLAGSFDKIMDAYHAVRGVLDTYENWLRASHNLGPPVDAAVQPNLGFQSQVSMAQSATGEVLQLSTALVLQEDGSYKETQVYLPPPTAVTAHVPQPEGPLPASNTGSTEDALFAQNAALRATRAVHPQPLFVDERSAIRSGRVIGNGTVPQREAQSAAVYPSLTHSVMHPVQTEQGQVIVLPATADASTAAAAANVYYPPAVETPSTGPMILHPKGMHTIPY